MASLAPPQLTLNFEPSIPERFPSLRSYIAHRVPLLNKSAKVIAAEMDMSPSTFSRKLNPADGDTQRLNVDDLEQYLQAAGPGEVQAVMEYLAARFLDSDESRRARVLSRVESLSTELATMLSSLRASA